MSIILSTAAWQLDKHQWEPHLSTRGLIAAADKSDFNAACYRLRLAELHMPSPMPWKSFLRARNCTDAIHKGYSSSDILFPFPSLHPTPLTALRIPRTPNRRRMAKVNPPSVAEATGWHPAISPKSAEQLSCPHGGWELSPRVSPRGSPQRGRAWDRAWGSPGQGRGRRPRGLPGYSHECRPAGAERLRVCCLPLRQRWLSGSAPAASGLLVV